ncbi:putative protein phosphatase methylesterase 1 [Monocercomonoides exilis]|uniref:putative protein phosphatase methylesterase 1 n=1 Tax=Monocercomonoides exilis TaxID=2049356 RepID=UPI003559DDBF|nr:putative protein phosphatase methylesterase 1 [Monocercomonoides exilis]
MCLPPPPPRSKQSFDDEEFRKRLMSAPPLSRQLTTVLPTDCFDSFEDVIIERNSFRVYKAGTEGVCFVLIHGAGLCAMEWGLFTRLVKGKAQVLAIDLRGHGHTYTENDEQMDLQTLVDDVVSVVNKVLPAHHEGLCLMGHSLGGSIAISVAHQGHLTSPLRGLFVIEVAEGTAMDSLSSMDGILASRPVQFPSMLAASKWVCPNLTRNFLSATLTTPFLFAPAPTGTLLPHSCTDVFKSPDGKASSSESSKKEEVGSEESKESAEKTTETAKESTASKNLEPFTSFADCLNQPGKVVWRAHLFETKPFWHGWYFGMNKRFLSTPVPKVLIVADIDRLDKDMNIANMQGKFQFNIIPNTGHHIHEDAPERLASIACLFLERYSLTPEKMKAAPASGSIGLPRFLSPSIPPNSFPSHARPSKDADSTQHRIHSASSNEKKEESN